MSEKAAVDELGKRIQDAALSGKWSIDAETLSDFAKAYLKQHGYRIHAGTTIYTITWQDKAQFSEA